MTTLLTDARLRMVWTSLSVCLAASGCRQTMAKLKNLSYDSKATNIALLIGAPNGLSGIDLDLSNLEKVLTDSDAKYGFTVKRLWQADKDSIVQATIDAAKAVGSNGTLFWYFSGHGAKDGNLEAEGGSNINFDDLTKGIVAARTEPLKRLMVFADACYSGNLVNGLKQIGRDDQTLNSGSSHLLDTQAPAAISGSTVADSTLTGLQTSSGPATHLAEQLLVVAAVDQNTSASATTAGSAFTSGVAKAFQDLKAKPEATIGDFLQAIKAQGTSAPTAGGVPIYRAVPEAALLAEKLIGSGPTASPSSPSPSSSQSAGTSPATEDLQLYLALKEADASGATVVIVTSPESLGQVILCDGGRTSCSSAPKTLINFTKLSAKVQNQEVWQSQSAVKLQMNHEYTVVNLDSSGAAVGYRVVSLAPAKS